MSILIDTHCHLFADAFNADRPEAVARARAAGVAAALLPNIDLHTYEAMMHTAQANPNWALPMLGLHPGHIEADYEAQLDALEKHLVPGHPFVAIGEAGLDLYWKQDNEAEQTAALVRQAGWAFEHDLPLVLHSRSATQQVLAVLEGLAAQGRCPRAVLHCFSGTPEEADRAIALGCHLGIGGPVSYKTSTQPAQLFAISQKHGLGWIILETDAPYLPPVPHRGKRNEPSYLPLTAEAAADALHISLGKMKEVSTANALACFGAPLRNALAANGVDVDALAPVING